MHHLKALRYDSCVTRDRTVLPATHTQTIPVFTPKPQGVTALLTGTRPCDYPVGVARLS